MPSVKRQESLLKYRQNSERFTAGVPAGRSGDPKPAEQRYVTTDTGFGHVFTMMLLGICRRLTSGIPLRNRLIAYLALIIVGGLLNDFAPDFGPQVLIPKVNKTHPFNQWFVKWGWLWTLVLLAPYIHLTSKVVETDPEPSSQRGDQEGTHGARRLLRKFLTRDTARLIVTTAMWFFSVRFFYFVENYTAQCSLVAHGKNREACLKHGHRWLQGWDISGHTFLILFSQFAILEELRTMIGWEPFGNSLNAARQHAQATSESGDHRQAAEFDWSAPAIRALFVLLTCLTILWDFMFLQTCLFYHTMVQKLIAAIWAFILYSVCYKLFFRDPSFSLIVRGPISTKDL